MKPKLQNIVHSVGLLPSFFGRVVEIIFDAQKYPFKYPDSARVIMNEWAPKYPAWDKKPLFVVKGLNADIPHIYVFPEDDLEIIL